jgi:hypothetical protein
MNDIVIEEIIRAVGTGVVMFGMIAFTTIIFFSL